MNEFTAEEIEEKAKALAELADDGEAGAFYEKAREEAGLFAGNGKQWKEMLDRVRDLDRKGYKDDVIGGGVSINPKTGKEELNIPGLVYRY